jgi:hypothetical protein
MADKPDEGAIRQHICEAQTIIEGEDQLPRYVARLELAECAEILAASLIKLPSLAAKRDECRVGKDEKRSFEQVIRVWTLHVLSGLEGG